MSRESSTPAPLTQARPILLASGSPRRREILANLGIPFEARAVDVDESILSNENAAAYLSRVVLSKLRAAQAPAHCGGVLEADTSVIDTGAILGKPTSRDEAEQMIARLSGRTHEVWTRFAIGTASTPSESLHEETVITRVTFRRLPRGRVKAYVASGEGDDKAGAYAVQGLGAGIVSRIEGSYTNVVGLPACELVVALEALGLLP
jgi:septum formation protein